MILLDKNKNFYKANLHCHSTFSDGRYTPEELKEKYMAEGYSVIAYTDHEHLIDQSHLTDENFLAITACEVAIKEFPEQSTLKNWNMRVTHLNFYSLDPHNTVTPCYSPVHDHFIKPEFKDLVRYEKEYERVYTPECINEMVRMAKEQGFIVSYNHPIWSLENATDYLKYEGFFAIEIYNNSVVVGGGSDYTVNAFDDFLRAGKKIYCTMADDNHGDHMFGGFVMINAEKLDYATIMDCLQKGQFYASQGPKILSLVREGNKVIIETDEAVQISYSTRGRRAKAVHGEGLTKAEFEILPQDEYFRLTVRDQWGRYAHTQAYEV